MLHRGFQRYWCQLSDSWLERTLGRLIGTYEGCVARCEFNREVANKYDALARSPRDLVDLGRLESRLSDRVGRIMQHAAYGPDSCEDIVV